MLSVFQALGAITAVPVTGPQVSSLQRLAGQGAAVLPQVSSLGQRLSVCLFVCPLPLSIGLLDPSAGSTFPHPLCAF
jgi:hypothetical protein